MLGMSPKNLDALLKYVGGLHSHLRRQVLFFKPITIDEAYMQAQYLDDMDKKEGKPSGSKWKEHQDTSKEGKNKEKGEDKKTTSTTHQCKDPNNHCNHFNIDSCT